MRGKAMLALIPLALTACATTETPVPVAGGGTCTNDGLDRFVGQKASPELGAEALKAAKAGTLRWAAPGMALTMDYREDRVTVSYDDAMVVTSARCG